MRQLSIRCLFMWSFALLSCDRSSSQPAPAASVVATNVAAPSLEPTPAPPAPPDLDVNALKKKLCGGAARRQACRILNEFGAAARFEPRIPSGEGRWIGYSYALEKETKQPELIVLSASQVPTATVPAGELALHVGTGDVADDKHDHAVKLANALSRGDTVAKTNAAAPYVKAWKPADAQGTMSTSGTSIRLVTKETYLRQVSGGKVLLVGQTPSTNGSLEGIAAELWPSSW
ncbi:MAG TPA: hypothetical protein VGL13_12680 [Polyangiaceae bacterium]